MQKQISFTFSAQSPTSSHSLTHPQPGRVFSSALFVEYGKGGIVPGVFQILSEQQFQESETTTNYDLVVFWVFAAFNVFGPYYMYSQKSDENAKVRLSD